MRYLPLTNTDRADMLARFDHVCAHVRFEAEGRIDVGGYVPEILPK